MRGDHHEGREGREGREGGRKGFEYAPFYCEENVWQLCRHPDLEGFEKEAVFISNPRRACLLWEQKASEMEGAPVCWDYHVILVVRRRRWEVWDLDSRLGAPVDAGRYFERTFPPGPPWRLPVRFRALAAEEFVSKFNSDRSHMRTAQGVWTAPPPPWPPILKQGGYPLMELIDMVRADPGTVLTLEGIRARYRVDQP